MPRLFTAIEIPKDVALSLSLLRGGLPGARWIDPENYHLTLRFIGDVERPTALEIANALARTNHAPFALRLVGLDAFGGNKPHSLHVRAERSAALSDIQASHERIMRRVGLKAETRKFIPHVTLARLRGAKGADVANYLSLRGNFSLPPFTVGRIVLYSSRSSVGGGPYMVEQSLPLTRDGERQGQFAGDVHALGFTGL